MPYVPPHRRTAAASQTADVGRSLTELESTTGRSSPRQHVQREGTQRPTAEHGSASVGLETRMSAVDISEGGATSAPRHEPPGKHIPPRPSKVNLSTAPDPAVAVPVVALPGESELRMEHGVALVDAFAQTGFVLVSAPDTLTHGCAKAALRRCAEVLDCPPGERVLGGGKVSKSGGKEAVMLRAEHLQRDTDLFALLPALVAVKRRVLKGLELGLNLAPGALLVRHADHTDAIRLLRYPPRKAGEGKWKTERCYEHVDYGTVTLLIQDRHGLEVRHEQSGVWLPVGGALGEDVSEGALIAVNIGKELAESVEARGQLPLSYHRVPGPESVNSLLSVEQLLIDITKPRHSIAYFVQAQQYKDSASPGAGKNAPRNTPPKRY